MKAIEFTKMVASGNDFLVVGSLSRYPVISKSQFARKICDRKYGAGADGLLVLEKSKVADIRMRLFNADGSEAEMCGNGARCVALWMSLKNGARRKKYKIETKAGTIESEVRGRDVRIRLTDPGNIKLNIPIKIDSRKLNLNFINTGVPHVVIFTEGLGKIDIVPLGRYIRHHKKFSPRGTNVNFVEVLSRDSIQVRTYERGVEDETLACGTGAVASALLTTFSLELAAKKIHVHTQGQEILKVYFTRTVDGFKNVWLEGVVKKVYGGVYDV